MNSETLIIDNQRTGLETQAKADTAVCEPCNFTLNRLSESEIVIYTRIIFTLCTVYRYVYHSYHTYIWEF